MMQSRKFLPVLMGILIGISLPACGSFPAVPETTLTPTLFPLYQQVTLITSADSEESGSGPDYTLKTHTPALAGVDDPRVLTFNQQMEALIQQEVEAFKQDLLTLPVEPIGMGSYLEIGYEQVSPAGNLLSIKFTVDYYSDGAAHPGTYSHSVTYDLEAGVFLALEQLFLPGADYLKAISDHCITQLLSRDIAFDPAFTTGADPSAENYRNWNITADGLLITFDAYQVAAYAAGPQLVSIPYAELQSIIDPQGPLADQLK